MANRKLKPINRSNANVEAEKGETVITSLFGPNVPEHYIIEGEKHSKGGTPLNLPANSFIFSNSKELRITDESILEMFDMPKNKVGYTPAEIAKKYDINKYKEILLDPNADHYEKDTAILMVNNMFDKLSALALYQESLKGFPQGIPHIAIQFMEKNGISPEDLVPQTNAIQQGQDANQLPQQQAQLGISVRERPVIGLTTVEQENGRTTYLKPEQITELRDMYSLPTIPIDPLQETPREPIDDIFTKEMGKEITQINNEQDNKFLWQYDAYGMSENKEKEKKKRKLKNDVKFDINIPMNVDAAVFDTIGSVFRRMNEAKRQSELAQLYSGENKAIYTTPSLGDYVETGTQYGSFRPNEQTYAVNPQNIVNRSSVVMDEGGELKEVKKNIETRTKKKVIILDNKPTQEDFNKLDDNTIYIWKENDKIYYGDITYSSRKDAIALKEEQKQQIKNTKKEDVEFAKRAYLLSNIYEKSIEQIDALIQKANEEGDRTRAEELTILKKLQYTNKVLAEEIAKNPNIKDKETILNNLLSNRSEKANNELLKKVHNLKGVDKDLLLKEDEVKKAQEIYNHIFSNEDLQKDLGLKTVPVGFDDEKVGFNLSREDSLYGNTTAFYLLVPQNLYEKNINEYEYTKGKGLDKSKVLQQPQDKKAKSEFFTQDMVNLALALSERANIKKYMPYAEIPSVFLPEATYLSPERALAANQEAVSQMIDAAATLGTPQSYAAIASMLSGKQMQANANVLANIHNTNVSIANQFDMARNQMLNTAAHQRSQIRTSLYDKTTIANQQFDNAIREANRNIVAAFNQAWTNRGLANTMNQMSDYFSIDPITYTTYFDKDKYNELKAQKRKDEFEDFDKTVKHIASLPYLSDETKQELLKSYASTYFKEKPIDDNPYNQFLPYSLNVNR